MTFVQGLAKANRKKGSISLDFLKMHPDKFTWNEKGEMTYQGKNFYGPNMKNLISDVVTNRTKPSTQTFHGSAFMKALADLDVPKDFANANDLAFANVRSLQK